MSTLTQKLAKIGGGGKFPSNMERDLYRVLELPIEPFHVDLPVRSQVNRKDIELKRIPMLLPHEMYHYMFEACWVGAL